MHYILWFVLLALTPRVMGSSLVQQGVIDFRGEKWQFESVKKLEGDWRFFPNQFLSESDFQSEEWKAKASTFVHIPGALPNPDKKDHPWGTLVLEMRNLKSDTEDFAFRVRGDTAYRVFLYDSDNPKPWQRVMSVGVTAAEASHSIPQIAEKLGEFNVHKGQLSHAMLVVHISGFYYNSTSLWSPPQIGIRGRLQQDFMRQLLVDSFVCGMIFIMCVYFFSLYLHQPENYGPLWLGVYTGLNVFRMLSTSASLNSLIFPEPSIFVYELIRKFEIAGLPIMGSVCATFSALSMGHVWLKKYLHWNFLIAVGCTLVIAFLRTEVYMPFLPLIQIHMLLNIIFLIGISVHGVMRGKPGSRFLLAGMFFISAAAIYDMGVGLGFYTSVFIAPFGIASLIFCQGQVIARLFSNAFRTAKRLTYNLKAEVERQTLEIRTMLDHIPQGVLSIVEPGISDNSYSSHLTEILETTHIHGRSVDELLMQSSELSSDQRDRIKSAISAILNEDVLEFELNSGQFPTELNLRFGSRHKDVQVTWNPVTDSSNKVIKLLVTVHDVTQMKEFELETIARRQELEYIQEIVAVPADRLQTFLDSSIKFMEENSRLLKLNATYNAEVLKVLFVNLHTIKGSARTLGFNQITGILHEVEQQYAVLLKDSHLEWNQTQLLQDLGRANEAILRYDHINRHILGRTTSTGLNVVIQRELIERHADLLTRLISIISDNAMHEELELVRQKIDALIFENTADVLQDILSTSAKIAKDLNKEPPLIKIEGQNFQLTYQAQQLLRNIFTHIIRNSIDHGIESVAERMNKAKPPRGSIVVLLQEEEHQLIIRYRDDGRGLALEKLKAKGIAMGLGSAQTLTTPRDIGELMFHPGLSTADALTQHSGRGVGMEAIRRYLNEVGGQIDIQLDESNIEDGFCPFSFRISIPGELYCVREFIALAPDSVDNVAS